jgi:hypothetical protein
MIVFIFYFAVASFAVYTIFAFFEKAYAGKRLPPTHGDLENLKFRKEEILAAMSDLEYDFEMKKITEADYLQLKENLTREAVRVMKKLDEIAVGADKHEFAAKRSENIRS